MEEFKNTCPAGIYQEEIEILPEHVNADGDVIPSALACIMQQVTEAHMRESGWGYQLLRSKGLLWVIVWTSIEIEESPRLGDKCIVRTWPGALKLGMYSRRYIFFSEKGKELIRTCSLFMVIDETTRKMVLPDDLTRELEEVVVEGQPGLPRQQIKFPEMTFVQNYSVADDEIDANGHVNNSCYLKWAYNLLEPEYIRGHSLKYCWAQYGKELMQGENVELWYTMQKNELYVKGVSESNISFLLKMDFSD